MAAAGPAAMWIRAERPSASTARRATRPIEVSAGTAASPRRHAAMSNDQPGADLGANPAWRSAAPTEEDVLALLARADEGSRVLDGLVYCCVRNLIFRRVIS